MLIALLRGAAGQVSLTSTAPEAHSPPMPMPSTRAPEQQLHHLCDVAAPSDARRRSGSCPSARACGRSDRRRSRKSAPPTPDITSVTVPSMPGHVVAEPEVAAQLADRHGVEHEVHGVEHPAELRGGQHAPLLARDRAIPRARSSVRRRRRWRRLDAIEGPSRRERTDVAQRTRQADTRRRGQARRYNTADYHTAHRGMPRKETRWP